MWQIEPFLIIYSHFSFVSFWFYLEVVYFLSRFHKNSFSSGIGLLLIVKWFIELNAKQIKLKIRKWKFTNKMSPFTVFSFLINFLLRCDENRKFTSQSTITDIWYKSTKILIVNPRIPSKIISFSIYIISV